MTSITFVKGVVSGTKETIPDNQIDPASHFKTHYITILKEKDTVLRPSLV